MPIRIRQSDGKVDITIREIEVWAGHREIGGRIHGSIWKPLWEVSCCFESKAEAEAHKAELMKNWLEVTQER